MRVLFARTTAAALLLTILGGCGAALRALTPCEVPSFPRSAQLDYTPADVFARWALPVDGTLRVWVKGSDTFRFVSAECEQCTGEMFELTAPFYTAILPVPAPAVAVGFSTEAERRSEHVINLNFQAQVSDFEALSGEPETSPASPFSILAYGCFQPFGVRRESVDGVEELRSYVMASAGGRQDYTSDECASIPRSGGGRAPCPLVQIRRLLAARVTHPETISASWLGPRVQDTSRLGADFCRRESGLAAALFVVVGVGSGDQIYMDAGYGALGDYPLQAYPLSAWDTSGVHPVPRVRGPDFETAVDRTYRAFWSFTSLNEAWHSIPTVTTWDDHEIRDGWGSHDDEELYAAEFSSARAGFISHQFSVGPRTAPTAPRAHLAQSFTVRGTPVFVLDTRSDRGPRGRARLAEQHQDRCPRTYASPAARAPYLMLSNEQFCDFEEWARAVPSGREFVIVSSSPVFWGQSSAARSVYAGLFAEDRDDLRDAWSSPENSPQRALLIEILRDARERETRPMIVSGDVHMTIPIVAWDCADEVGQHEGTRPRSGCNEPRQMNQACSVLAYEMVTTGLANEEFARGFRGVVSWVEQSQHSDSLLSVQGRAIQATVFAEKVAPNFATIDFRPGHSTWFSWYTAELDGSGLTQELMEVDWNRSRCADNLGRDIRPLPRFRVFYRESSQQ